MFTPGAAECMEGKADLFVCHTVMRKAVRFLDSFAAAAVAARRGLLTAVIATHDTRVTEVAQDL